MSLVFLLILLAVFVFGATAVWGLVWAVKDGQMRNFASGARSIFDEDEPVGRVTDWFPDTKPNATDATADGHRPSEDAQ